MNGLSHFDELYKETDASDVGEVPAGEYEVLLDGADIRFTKLTQRPMLCFSLQILSGDFMGRHIVKNSVIGANSMKFLKFDLEKLGLKGIKLSEIESHFDKILGTKLSVVKTEKNINLGKIAGKIEVACNYLKKDIDELPF